MRLRKNQNPSSKINVQNQTKLTSPKIQETSLKISRIIDLDHDQIWTNHLHSKINLSIYFFFFLFLSEGDLSKFGRDLNQLFLRFLGKFLEFLVMAERNCDGNLHSTLFRKLDEPKERIGYS